MARLRRIATRSRLRLARPISTDRLGGGRRPHSIQGVLCRHERSDRTVAGALSAWTGYRTPRYWLVLLTAIVPASPAGHSARNLTRKFSTFACAPAVAVLLRATAVPRGIFIRLIGPAFACT